jgi:hypothetical protein
MFTKVMVMKVTYNMLRYEMLEKSGTEPFNSLLSSARLPRLWNLVKPGEMGPIKPYPDRFTAIMKERVSIVLHVSQGCGYGRQGSPVHTPRFP